MQTLERLGADELVSVVTSYRDALRAHQAVINRLNVYPVPDGDTGTNMALTLESVVAEIEARGPAGIEEVCEAVNHGSLMGARGNSGVILSQILRGLADAVRQAGGIDAATVSDGLARATAGAYKAVQKPVEGTILTVVRAASEGCAGYLASASAPELVASLEAGRAAAEESLALTPELLPALKAAGVVDSGGAGFVLLLDAFLHVADGRPLPAPPALAAVEGLALEGGSGAEDVAPDAGTRYEVMYLLEAADSTIPSFRDVWAGLGDSIVVVGGDGIFNCHIHTDDIGAAIEAALDAGRPRQIRVTDLWEQVEEERWVREAEQVEEFPVADVPCAVVAVCAGEGIRRIFHSLGVSRTVSGGQSMNPSTAELLAAIEAVPAEDVIVLPNNKNIVPVAEAAAAESTKSVAVVATRGITEGFAALLDYDPEADAAANAETMGLAASRVASGEVTQAVRASSTEFGFVHPGDWLGISRIGIEVVAPTAADAAIRLIDRLLDGASREIVTLITGDDATAADTRRVTEWLAEHHPELTAEVHRGGQPLYPYLLSVE